MSQENVEVVRRIYDAAARNDAGALELYDPDIEFDFSRSPFGTLALNKAVYRGHAGLRDFFHERYEAWKSMEDECLELIEADDKVISVVVTRGVGRESGLATEQTHFAVWSVSGGRATSAIWFGTRDAAFEAAGLSE